jgi:hypothetical protein
MIGDKRPCVGDRLIGIADFTTVADIASLAGTIATVEIYVRTNY